jgi:hypothetical protein
MTDVLINLMPKILEKFGSDKVAVSLLLQIPRCFNLDRYVTSQGNAQHGYLLDQMTQIFQKTGVTSVLTEVCLTFSYLADTESKISLKVSLLLK